LPHKHKKRFGQHFLKDDHVLQTIAQLIAPQSSETFVEIGPGQGALTQYLVDQVQQLDLIELDRDLIASLHHKYASDKVKIHQTDALKFDYNQIQAINIKDSQKIRLVGNLPYNISTPLLFHLFTFKHIHDMHFMLQKEVVDRMVAQPGNKQYGRLSIMVQYHSRADILLDVPPEAFDPPPRVNSAIVRLCPWETLPHVASNHQDFNTIVTSAFSQRRKTIRNGLKKLLDQQQIEQLDVDPSQRPEQLSIETFIKLANLYSKTVAT
jgi:16S rRNA (adenine1518-N6/adenine1519-N6)-dimethyltransferase